ncbi:MAG TPA: PQQ-dependent sugar dehydrogenase [Candidatus Kapabacteria bacterium]|nr:PQQ-dependent sugar dehydrogenase [Candidatus Kapabacteria bacterium]
MGPSTVTQILAVSLLLAQTLHAQQAASSAPQSLKSSMGELRVERLATLEYPWGMAWLPDGRLLITEKPGRLRIWENGQMSGPVEGVPKAVYRGPRDQGGMLDVAVDPNFAENGLIYLSFVEAADQQPESIASTDDFRLGGVDLTDNVLRGGAVARAKLEANRLTDSKVIWRQFPKTVGRGHFGNRIVFAQDGKMFITSADRMRFEPAQSLGSNLGKVVRINSDGSVPQDNPFVGREGARGDIWSYGHRNMLSAAIDPANGNLWVVEMGPSGGDELNIVQKGTNYGWPLVSDGSHYTRQGVSTAFTMVPGHGSTKEFKGPVRTFTPVISPSGAIFYTGEMFKDWRGSMLLGGLSSMALIRLALDGEQVAIEERINLQRRIRDVIEAKDGALLVIVDAKEGELLRLTPAKASGN